MKKISKFILLLLLILNTLVFTKQVSARTSLSDNLKNQKAIVHPSKNQSRVYVLKFDPILSEGRSVSQYLHDELGYKLYETQIKEAKQFFLEASKKKLKYKVVASKTLRYWPVKTDGFQYTEQEYLDVIHGNSQHHEPDFADYYQFLNDEKLDVCGKLNRNEIDEVWLFGGPWFGFYESTMASHPGGPGFWVNGPTFYETNCKKLLPVGIPGAHTFGHRFESTMQFVYGSWEQNNNSHRWNQFGLEKAHSPSFSTFGCGSVHYAPNALNNNDDYDFNLTNYVSSNCNSFMINPNTRQPIPAPELINCEEWGCTTSGYEMWWWKHIPNYSNRGYDTKLNNWWTYFIDPNKAYPEKPGKFSNLSATFPYEGDAQFNFKYSQEGLRYTIDVSTLPDMSYDVYVNFAQSGVNPIIETNPKKWDKYSCGRDLYWRVKAFDNTTSPIIKSTVTCKP